MQLTLYFERNQCKELNYQTEETRVPFNRIIGRYCDHNCSCGNPVSGVCRARENARRATCLSNLKQVGMGLMMYNQDYDEQFPPSFNYYNSSTLVWWQDALQPYIKTYQIFICPSDTSPKKYTNARATSLGYPSALYTSYAVNESALPYIKDGGWYYEKGNYLAAYAKPSKTILILDCDEMEIHYNFSDTSLKPPGNAMKIAKSHL